MLKLIDFGIAAQIVSNESTVYRKGIQGTLNYISPEAIDCRPNGDGYEVLILLCSHLIILFRFL